MDVDRLLNFEKRTGIKDAEIEDFIGKVDAVNEAIQGMKDGVLAPEDVKIKGLPTPEELAAKEEARREALKKLEREQEERRVKLERDEKEKWWRGAELMYGDRGTRVPGEAAGDAPEHLSEASADKARRLKDRYSMEYSRWDTWTPDDPVSKEEEEEKAKKEEEEQNKIFEANNPDFCQDFIGDLQKREEAREKKENAAGAARLKGNRYYKLKKWDQALEFYQKSLRSSPYQVSTLSNTAQVYLKLQRWEAAVEFCDRALHIDPMCIKALSRRATARVAIDGAENLTAALADLEVAVKAPSKAEGHPSPDLVKQYNDLKSELEDREVETAVMKLAASTKGLDGTEQKDEKNGEAGKEPVSTPAPVSSVSSLPNDFTAVDELLDHIRAGTKVNATHQLNPLDMLEMILLESLPARVYLRQCGALDYLVQRLCGGGLGQPIDVQRLGSNAEPPAPAVEVGTDGSFEVPGSATPSESTTAEPSTSAEALEASDTTPNRSNSEADEDPERTLAALAAAVKEERKSQLLVLGGGALQAAGKLLKGGVDSQALELRAASARLLHVCTTTEEACEYMGRNKWIIQGLLQLLGEEGGKGTGAADAAAIVRELLAAGKNGKSSPLGTMLTCKSPGLVHALSSALHLQLGLQKKEKGGHSSDASVAICGALANLGLHERGRAALSELQQEPSVVSALLGAVRSPRSTDQARSLALAALMNACVEPSGAFRASVHELGGVTLLLATLAVPEERMQAETRSRVAGALYRVMGFASAVRAVAAPRAFRVVLQALKGASTATGTQRLKQEKGPINDLREHLIRIIASVLKLSELRTAALMDEIKKAGTIQCLLHLLPPARRDALAGKVTRDTVALAPEWRVSEALGANICSCLIHLLDDLASPAVQQIALSGGIEQLLSLFANSSTAVRKNAAVCIAKMARHADWKGRIEELRGIEMLLETSKSIV